MGLGHFPVPSQGGAHLHNPHNNTAKLSTAPTVGGRSPRLLPVLAAFLALSAVPSHAVLVCSTAATPPNGEVVSVCTTPYQSTADPFVGTGMTVTLVLASGTAGLSVDSVVINGVDRVWSFNDRSGGEYTVTYATPAGDQAWPWTGLHVQVVLTDAGSALAAQVDAVLVPGALWTEASSARGMSGFAAAGTNPGLCVSDFDDDGNDDVFVAAELAPTELWVNSGATLSNKVADYGLGYSDSQGCAFGDADGDGLLDVLVSSRGTAVDRLYMQAGGTFTLESTTRGVTTSNSGRGVCWGDIEGDADLDLFICMEDAENMLYINDGRGGFADEAAPRGVQGAASSESLGAALVDIDDDGDLDLLVVSKDATPNNLYVNNGTGNFTDESTARGFDAGSECWGLTVADWSGDGFVDVFVSVKGARDLLYENTGSGVFVEVGASAGLPESTRWSVGAVATDFDLDGDLDLVVAGFSTWLLEMWVNNGFPASGFVDAAADFFVTAAGCTGVVAVDLDDDGDEDVLSGNCGNVLTNNNARPGVHRSVNIRPLTAAGAQSAFGAAVRLECVGGGCGGWVGLRVLDGGSGYGSQNGYDAVFGVPVPSGAYNGSVRWAGDAHPASSWASHPRLGGIVPSTLASAADRLLVVRPLPLTMSVSAQPWDFAGVTTRAGEAEAAPGVGDSVEVIVTLQPAVGLQDLSVVSAFVNGQDVGASWAPVAGGAFALQYMTEAGGEDWPWSGLEVEVVVEDSGGLASSASLATVVGSTWSEEAADRGLAALTVVSGGRGLCMGDVDGDGDIDIYAALYGTGNQLWINGGSGVFANEAADWGVASGISYGCGFGDLDVDGDLDLIVTTETIDDALFINTGSSFTDERDNRGLAGGGSHTSVALGDINSDGAIEIFVCTGKAVNALYVNNGVGVFVDEAGPRGVMGTSRDYSRSAVFADLDDDGALDLLLLHDNDGSALFMNNGSGTFANEIATRGWQFSSVKGRGLAVGDWSGDGVVDIVVADESGRDLMFVNDGSGVFAEVGAAAGVTASSLSEGVTLLDVELDGDVDIGIGVANGADLVWVNGGGGGFVEASSALSIGSTSTCWAAVSGDIDGDGDEDVVSSTCGMVHINHNARPGVPRSVVIRPLTAAGAQSAFGAAVRLECVGGGCGGWVGLRVLDGGSGYESQNGYDAVFGVPVPSGAYNGSVRWAGDAHPASSWASHPRLGGIVPSSLASSGRLVVVRPSRLSLVVSAQPWDHASAVPPAAGDVAVITVKAVLAVGAGDLSLVSAAVNGHNVSSSLVITKGSFTVQYVTEAGEEDWPWSGLEVEVEVEDSGGLVSSVRQSVVAGSTWSEVSGDRGVALMSNSNGRAVCMADADGDGDIDMFVAMGSSAAYQFWMNSGGGVFTDEAADLQLAHSTTTNANGCAFGDVDGDGWVDLLVTVDSAADELYMNIGAGFVADGAARGIAFAGTSFGAAFGDVDGDEDVDLFVATLATFNTLYINDGSGVFVDDAQERGVGGHIAANSRQAVLIDIDGDSDLDVLVVQVGTSAVAPTRLYVNNGTGAFVDETEARGFAFALQVTCSGVVAGDWSGDGFVDVYITTQNSRDLLFVSGGGGFFREVGVAAGTAAPTGFARSASLLDFELDGDVDIGVMVENGPDVAWLNAGAGFADASTELGLGSPSAATSANCMGFVSGDIDGDRDEDAVGARCGDVYINHNARPGVPRSVVIRPLTAAGAQSAFGAAVRLECVGGGCDGWVGLRVLDGGSGYFSQNGYDAVFGVPVPSGAYNGSVRWAGDAHPASSWASHPRLGGIVPSTLASSGRLLVVRPSRLSLVVSAQPWDFAGVTTRVGGAEAAPGVGDSVEVRVAFEPGVGVRDMMVVSAFVNGQGVGDSWALVGGGGYTLQYVTEAGGEDWPWSGLEVEVEVEDSGGLVSTLSTTVVASSTFGQRTGLPLPANASGICTGDVDGDGDIDVVVGSGSGLQLFTNAGNGSFAASTLDGDGLGACALADVTDGGLLDVLVAPVGGGRNRLYVGEDAFGEDGVRRAVGVAAVADGRGVAVGDVDGDGGVDVFVCVAGAPNQLYVNNGTGFFALRAGAASPALCVEAIMVDVEGDTDLDIVVVNDNGNNELFLNGGDGNFVEVGVQSGFSAFESGRGVAGGDVDGDGWVDLVVAGFNGTLVYMNTGNGSFLLFDTLPYGAGDSVAILDLDYDGDVDVMLSGNDVTSGYVLQNGGGGVFSSRGEDFGFGGGLPPHFAVGDMDGDGDVDVVGAGGAVYDSHAAQPGIQNWVVVKPLTAGGASSAFGAAVRVVCVVGSPWSAVRVVGGDSSCGASAVHVGLPPLGDSFDVQVTFVGGATHNKSTDVRLGGVTGGTTLVVVDRPYLAAVRAVYVGEEGGKLRVNDTVVFVLEAGQGRLDLEPAPGCCVVNGAQIRDSFVRGGDGTYTLSYVLGEVEGGAVWGAGELVVAPTLQSTGRRLSMVQVVYPFPDSPSGDPIVPTVVLDCRPGVASASVWDEVCVSCPGEATCTFSYAVDSLGLGLVEATVPAPNYTSPTAATILLGPFNMTDVVTLAVLAVDGSGNPGHAALEWRVDTTSPVTTLVEKPDPVTRRDGATFTLQCSEAECTFAYVLDGGPLTPLGGNETQAGEVLAVSTGLQVAPGRVSNESSPQVAFSVGVSRTDMLVNGSVEVDLGSRQWTLGLVGNGTEVLQLPELEDGVYVVRGVGESGGGVVDVTPVEYAFMVDTRPPVTTVLKAPVDGEASFFPTLVVAADEEDCTFLWRAGPLPLNASWNASEVGVMHVEVVSRDRHGFEARAVDAAGNAGDVVVVNWTPESLPACPAVVPDVTITSSTAVGLGHRYVTFGGAGVDSFEYRVDGGAWLQTPSKDAVVEGAALGQEHTLEVRASVLPRCSEGVAASRPPPRAVSWTEPQPLPHEAVFVGVPDVVTPDVFAEFAMVASHRLAWLEYSLDREGWAPCGEVLVVGPLQAGEHTMRVRAVGAGGGNSGAVLAHTWSITAASDSSIVLSGLPDGGHTLVVVATDEAGTQEVSPRTFSWRVDTTRPVFSGVRASALLGPSRTAVVNVTCEGEVDPCAFCWTSASIGDNCTDAAPVLLKAPGDGEFGAVLWAVDTVGLDSEVTVEVVWAVDSVPPETFVSEAGGAFITPLYDTGEVDAVVAGLDVRLNVTAGEAVVGFAVVVNDQQVGGGLVGGGVVSVDVVEGRNEVVVWGVDLAGNAGAAVTMNILADLTPPNAVTLTSDLPAVTNETWVVVGVACEDGVGGSGVERVVVFLDGVQVAQVPGGGGAHTLTGLSLGVHNVSAVGVDVAGNVGRGMGGLAVEVDQVPPESSFVVRPPGFHPSSELAVRVSANEAGAVFGRVVGVTGWLPAGGGGEVSFSGLPDGLNVVEARSVDVAGNEEVPPFASADVVVDTVPPVLFWVSAPEAYTNDATTSGCFAANDTSPMAPYSVAPAAAVLQSPQCVEVVGVGDGRVGVNVTGTDAAGNVGGVLGAEWVLDRVAPVAVVDVAVKDSGGCVHVDGGVTVCNAAGGAEVEVSCSDGAGVGVAVAPCRVQFVVVLEEAAVGSGCAVVPSGSRRLAGVEFGDVPGGVFVVEGGEGDGLYAVAVRGVDEAGNVEEGNVTMTWYVDTVDPVRPSFVQQPDEVVSTTSVLFVVQLEGDTSPGQTTFWYKRDDGVGTAVEDLPVDVDDDVQLEFDELSPGNHKVEVWAVDQGGNVGPSVLHNWAVVTEAPGVEILEQPAAVSGDITPSFVFAARWGDRPAGNASEPSAGVEVSLNGAAEYVEVCADTVGSGGVCVWNASLVETGVGSYTINVRASLAGAVGNPTPFTWQYTVCNDDAFAVLGDDGGISCVECPVGGNCAGGLTGQADIAAVQGFWAPEGSSGLRFYECPVEEACLPGGEVVVGNATVRVVGQCAEGYTGTLCGVCEDGFFEQFGLCVSCGAGSGAAWAIMFAVLVAVVGVGVLFFKFRELVPIDQLKVTLSMVQIIASANTAYAIPWPPLFADYLNTMRVFLIEAVSLTRANCAQPMTFFATLVVTLVAFKVVLVSIVAGSVLLHKCRPGGRRRPLAAPGAAASGGHRARRRSSVAQAVLAGAHAVQAVDWAKIFKITFLFLFVTYPGVSLKIMTTFKCVKVEGVHWLVADMRLKCYEGEWFGYALYAFVMGCLYTGGLPLAITVILWRNRGKLGDEGVVRKWGFLYESYGVGAYLWEVVELLRKLWLSALVVLMAEGSPLQVTTAVLISGWAHVLHAVYKPWRGVGEGGTYVYALQHGSLLVTFFVFLMGLLFKVEGVSQDGGTYDLLAWAMLLACVAFLVAAFVVLVLAGTAQLRAVRRQKLVLGQQQAANVTAWRQEDGPAPDEDSARAGAQPRAVRTARLREGSLAWVGNPLRGPEK